MNDNEPERSVDVDRTVTTDAERKRSQPVEPMRIQPWRRTVNDSRQTPLEHRHVKHLPATHIHIRLRGTSKAKVKLDYIIYIYYQKSYSKYSKKYQRNRNLTSTHT